MLLQSWDRGIFWNQNQENERIEAIPPPSCASLAAAFYQMTFHMLAQLLWFWPQPDMHSETSPDFLFHSSSLLKVSQPATAAPFGK